MHILVFKICNALVFKIKLLAGALLLFVWAKCSERNFIL